MLFQLILELFYNDIFRKLKHIFAHAQITIILGKWTKLGRRLIRSGQDYVHPGSLSQKLRI